MSHPGNERLLEQRREGVEELAVELAEALRIVTDHLASVMGGPMIAGQGIVFANGVEGIPTIKRARAVLAQAEAVLR